ncbi:hypothetical protein UO65_2102 [Actinokineospora spheciospongiae]|uniref:DUF2382 domain-containing protein n=1 Tax=Actinokineospora spheciospongiae TaxID=909613 RepID=W7J9C4_9PSEU|nr:PRC and DUF2382 domain-containing protein [Actinokineospora spheciospongiae]EWC62599.1 hypothetical protein UO65_2102 [Actinokineospora spheciospongiae]PWW62381.1 uncharacterized protein (TIGR02271 family) [Actinokineospora spheciospongiae]
MGFPKRAEDIIGLTAHDRSGDKVGKIGQVYYDDQTEQPKWVTVNTGLFGMNESFVPLQGARADGDTVVLGQEKSVIKDAPNVGHDQHLSEAEEMELYRYYGLKAEQGQGERAVGTERRAEPVRTGRGNGEATMTRSEERLNVGTRNEEVGKVRLRKHVVTEEQQVSVPVRREELRVERTPITGAERGAAGKHADFTEAEQEVTLHQERPVVGKEAVPVEKVRVGTETVTENETVRGEVRKEQVEVDGADERRRR